MKLLCGSLSGGSIPYENRRNLLVPVVRVFFGHLDEKPGEDLVGSLSQAIGLTVVRTGQPIVDATFV